MWYNPLVKWLLNSPLYWTMGNTMLLTYVGRKSRQSYTTPVNYIDLEPNTFAVICKRERVWWRNFQQEANAQLMIRQRRHWVIGTAYEKAPEAHMALSKFFERSPRQAKYFDIHLDDTGHPRLADINKLSQDWLVVIFTTTGED